MFKKVKHGIEIDSVQADKGSAPKFGKRKPFYAPEEEKPSAPKFGKKKVRKERVAKLLKKARKGE